MTLRPFDPDRDWPALTALENRAEPEYSATEQERRAHDAMREPKIRHHRLVAEQDGALIGVGSVGNQIWSFDPRKFSLDVTVDPERRRQGVGAALYDALLAAIADADPLRLASYVREDRPESVAFAQKRGFVEVLRAWESRLDVAAFDPAPFDDVRRKPEAAGLRLTDFKTLVGEDGEAAYRKLYAMAEEVDPDVPRADGEVPTMPDYDHWRSSLDKSVRFRPEGFFIAVAPDGSYAGVSMLFHPQAARHVDTGLTGVRRAWRRHGIALALKLKAIDYAKALGAPEIRTDNAQQNRAMLSINEALGFVKQPAWIEVAREIV